MVLACISFSYSGRRSINCFKVWANCWSGYSASTCFNNAWQLVSGQFCCNWFNNCVILPGFFWKSWMIFWMDSCCCCCCIFDSSLFAAASFSCKLLGWAVSVRDGEDAWVWPDVAYDEPRPNHITTPITNTLSTKAISPKRFIVLPYGLYWNWPITGKWSDKSQVINTGSAVERRMRTSLRACIGWRWLLDDTT